MTLTDYSQVISQGMITQLFHEEFELLSGVTEVYELELAYLESKLLKEEEIINNGAYFARIGDRLTRHFLMCQGESIKLPYYSSSRLKSFFQTNQFKIGYATHGLFPYRGKFHPQMIKALMNIMGLKAGDKVLDPMMGSGTVLLEAKLMGIKSFGLDISPFCKFMTQVKLDGLLIAIEPIQSLIKDSQKIYEYFKNSGNVKFSKSHDKSQDIMLTEESIKFGETFKLSQSNETTSIFKFFLLAYLDSVGYSERSNKKSHFEQFQAIIDRYIFVIEKIQRSIAGMENELAEAIVIEGDARCLPVEDTCIDGIIFSPPYSFAIDYLENDSFHLNYLDVDIKGLRENMVGLHGKTLKEKYDYYLIDMKIIISECARVLRPGRFCTIIIGTNDNQLSKILKKPAGNIQTLDEIMIEFGSLYGLKLVRKIERQITGMANTMRTESIVMLQKES